MFLWEMVLVQLKNKLKKVDGVVERNWIVHIDKYDAVIGPHSHSQIWWKSCGVGEAQTLRHIHFSGLKSEGLCELGEANHTDACSCSALSSVH